MRDTRSGGARPAASATERRGGGATTPPIVRALCGLGAGALERTREASSAAVAAVRRRVEERGSRHRHRAGLRERAEGIRDAASARVGRVGEVWWIGSAEPITLRLPRGATVLVITGVVGIIVMAFAAGRRTGRSEPLAEARPAVAATELASVATPSDPTGYGGPLAADGVPGGSEWPAAEDGAGSGAGFGAGVATPPAAAHLQARFDAGLDPRVDGLNYLVYLTATRRECLRLADFLGDHGVQAVVMSASRSVRAGDGDGKVLELPLYWVVDVGEGFTRNQYLRGEHTAFRDERMELGRDWKRHNGGLGSDLADMQFYAYRASASPSARRSP